MFAKARLFLNAEKNKLVHEDSAEAAFLYAAPGDEIPDSAAEMFGLVDGDLPGTKGRSGSANKGKKASADKSGSGDDDKSGSGDDDKSGSGDDDTSGAGDDAGASGAGAA